jgi:hypothetical protein
MSDNVVHLNLHRELSEKEKDEFKKWANENWKVDDPVNPVWHPSVVEECAVMLDTHIRENTQKYAAGIEYGTDALDWNYGYKDMTVAIDVSAENEMSEKEQYEIAIEYFWEAEWTRLTGEEGEAS